MTLLHNETTSKILKTFYDVYNELGFGFLEKVYENSLHLELIYRGHHVEAQKRIKVFYKNQEVGVYCPDLVIDGKVILEVKAQEYLLPIHDMQLINYLKSTDVEVGLLLNFGRKPDFKRKVLENSLKKLPPPAPSPIW